MHEPVHARRDMVSEINGGGVIEPDEIKDRLYLADRSLRDRVKARSVASRRLARAFRQVQDDALACPFELVLRVVLEFHRLDRAMEPDRQFISQKNRDRNRCRFRLP